MAGLTTKAIEQAKPKSTRYEIADGGCAGLFLVVQPTGAKSWALRFRSPVELDERGQRKAKKLTLGTVALIPTDADPQLGHPLTIGQARMLATVAMENVRRGIDPTHTRREEKATARQQAIRDDTVDAAMVEFLRRYKGKKKQGLRDSTRHLTAHYFGLKLDPDNSGEWIRSGNGVLKSWSSRRLSSITKADAIVLLDKLMDDGKGVTANRTLTNLKTFFDWCVKRDMVSVSPVASLDAVATEVTRERTLSDLELVALWRVADREKYPFGRLFQLALLTGVRRDELRKASWSEFQLDGAQITLPNGSTWQGPLWTVPAGRVKNGREHEIPLSAAALTILKTLPRIKGKGLLFTTTGETSISGMAKAKSRIHDAMLAELRQNDPKAQLQDWSLHDLRRTFYTGLQSLGFSIEVAEACVNHSSGTCAVWPRFTGGTSIFVRRRRRLQRGHVTSKGWSVGRPPTS